MAAENRKLSGWPRKIQKKSIYRCLRNIMIVIIIIIIIIINIIFRKIRVFSYYRNFCYSHNFSYSQNYSVISYYQFLKIARNIKGNKQINILHPNFSENNKSKRKI